MSRPQFGRREPSDWKHVERFPLTAATTPDSPMPVVLGINWYEAFDWPVPKDGRWWIKETNLGPVLGGHAICVKPAVLTDPLEWWDFYNQNPYPECVGFSESRAKSLVDRTRYDARWLYAEAQKIDEWPGEDYDGTSVRAGLEILRTRGHRRRIAGVTQAERPGDGISAYRWLTSVAEVHSVIKMPLADQLGAVPLLQTWGRTYPHIVWLPDSVLERLLDEYGEAATFTDR